MGAAAFFVPKQKMQENNKNLTLFCIFLTKTNMLESKSFILFNEDRFSSEIAEVSSEW